MDNALSLPPVIGSLPPPLPRPQPIAPSDRFQILDVLRGFALFGILLVNMALFSWPVYDIMFSHKIWPTRIDVVADTVVLILAEGKFYLLFAFLFGAGAGIQMQRADERAGNFIRLYCRRLFVLLGFGLAHAFLIWEGDILTMYAVCGFGIIPFRRCKPATLLIWACLCALVPLALYLVFWVLMGMGSFVPEIAAIIDREIAAANAVNTRESVMNIQAFANGSFTEILIQRARNVGFLWSYSWFITPVLFAMFLFGLCAQRRILSNLATHAGLLRRIACWGMPVGLIANVIYAIAYTASDSVDVDWRMVVAVAAIGFGGPALSFAYASTIALLIWKPRWPGLVHALAAAGRMALTNYLLQSFICTTIFYSYGFGLYGSVGRASGLLIAMVVYAVQLPLSVWWLNRFRFGPAEWLWRSLTYGESQPMRL